MSADRDPKNRYSYQEMVDRLRENRPEGSRVKSEEREVDPDTGKVTVRRQKRRRTGKKKSGLIHNPMWFRLFRRLAYIGIPILLVLLVVAYFVVAASTGTGRFQEGVGRALVREFGVESATLKDTKLRAFTLLVGQAALQGKPGSMIGRADMQEVEMRLSPRSFLGGHWKVGGCSIANLKLTLAAPHPVAVAKLDHAHPLAAGFLLAEEPERIHFPDVTVDQADILFGSPANPSPAARDALPGLRKVRASLLERASQDGSSPYFDLQIGGGRDGTLTLPGWPAFRIEVLRAELCGDGATLKRSAFRFSSPAETKLTNVPIGFVEAIGTIPSAAAATAELQLTLRDVSLADILAKNVSRYLSGTLQAEALRLTWKTSDPINTWTIEGPIALRRVHMRDLNVFNGLSEITTGEVSSLDFDECTAFLNVTSEGTRLSEIRARGLGRAFLTGEIKVASNGKLDGQVQLGISQESISEFAPPFFKPGEDSASWTPVVLSGSASNPAEDLSARIATWAASQTGGKSAPRLPRFEDETPGLIPEPRAPGVEPGAPGQPDANDQKILDSLYEDLLKEP